MAPAALSEPSLPREAAAAKQLPRPQHHEEEQPLLDAAVLCEEAGPLEVLLDTQRTHVAVWELHDAVLGGPVVVKRFRLTDEEARKRFDTERRLLCRLSAQSEHVLKPLAAIVQPPFVAVVLPWCRTFGSLDKVLHGTGRPEITEEWRRCLARDCAAGVAAAHALDVVLRDIKTANILVGDDGVARMADLELAASPAELKAPAVQHCGGPATRPRKRFEGTPEYVSPEQIKAYMLVPGADSQRRASTFASDVYALAIVLNEIMSGVVPYTDVKRTDEQLHTVIETGYSPAALCQAVAADDLRPSLVKECSLGPLIESAWSKEKASRPSASKILAEIDAAFAPLDCAAASRSSITTTVAGSEAARAAEAAVTEPLASRGTAAVLAAPRPAKRFTAADIELLRTCADRVSAQKIACNPTRKRFCAGGGEGTQGRRDSMEDAFAVAEWAAPDAACFVVADGHGGSACAQFVCARLPDAIAQGLLDAETTTKRPRVEDVLRAAFAGVEQDWCKGGDASGACAVAALLLGDRLFVAHCGDCRAVLDRGAGEDAWQLTADHAVTAAMAAAAGESAEAARVIDAGGSFVSTADGRHRIRAALGEGGVQVSRSFGDSRAYPGVSAEPEVTMVPLTSADATLVLATDGLWEVMTPRCAVRRVRSTVREKSYGAKRLIGDALDLGATDNLCAVVVYLNGEGYSLSRTVCAASGAGNKPASGA